MRIGNLLPYLWKTPIFGFALFVGVIVGDFLASQIGLETPAALSIFSPFTLAVYLLAISPVLLASLLFLCRLSTGNFLSHWLTLSFLTWVVYSFSTSVRKRPQVTFLALSPYLMIIFFFSSFISTGVAVLMFPEHYKHREELLIGKSRRV